MNSTGVSAGAVPTIKCEDTCPSSMLPADMGGGSSSYNLSVNVNLSSAVTNLLAAESGGVTPRTPEILNSLIAMTNPLDQYSYDKTTSNNSFKAGFGNDSNSSMSNGSSATSPASGTPPSIQKTCSDLIKAGLKLSIESKRKMSGSDTDSTCLKRLKKEDSEDEYDSSHTATSKSEGLTPEDEERRRRRRERNKIAATKCRMKKRERTVNLVTESEVLENQNIDLKSQLKDLEVQRRQLVDMLSLHNASCLKNNAASQNSSFNMLRPYESPNTFQTSYESPSPYIRPESANILASSYTCVTPLNGDSSIDTLPSLDNSYMIQQLPDSDYHRPDSVLSLQASSESSYVTTDGYLPKATNLLVIEPSETEYYEHEVNYNMAASQQCHSYPNTVPDTQNKISNGLNDGCLV